MGTCSENGNVLYLHASHWLTALDSSCSCSCSSCSWAHFVHRKRSLFVCHALQQFARSTADYHLLVSHCSKQKSLLALLLACCIYKYLYIYIEFSRQFSYVYSDIYRTNATPRGFPLILSFKMFFCTMVPYLPNIVSITSSLTVRGRFVTYKFVSLMSSPEGRAYET